MDIATTGLDLVGQIYDCVERPELWPATVQNVSDSLGSNMTTFAVVDLSSGEGRVGVYCGGDETDRIRYESYYAKLNVHNLHTRRCAPLPPGTVVDSTEWNIDAELLRSEYYNDFLRPLHSFHLAGGVVAQDHSCLSVFASYRALSRGPFGDQSIALLRLLLPHLQKAVQLNQRLSLLRSMTEDFEDFSTAAILFDRSAHVVRVNRRAHQIIGQNDGLILRRGGLELAAKAQGEELKRLIRDCCATSNGTGSSAGGALAIQRTSGKLAYHLVISAIRFSPLVTGLKEPAAILFLSDPEELPTAPEMLLRSLYELTRAETRLCNLLLEGKDLTQACGELHTSRNTGRAHLRNTFDKLGVRTQGQLVARLAHSVAAMRRPQFPD